MTEVENRSCCLFDPSKICSAGCKNMNPSIEKIMADSAKDAAKQGEDVLAILAAIRRVFSKQPQFSQSYCNGFGEGTN